MRKNYMMRAASALLVAVLITTSAISGTFAKYVTTSAANDEARVAKWGVELQIVGNLFGDSYGAGNKIVKDDDGSVTVQSFNVVDTAADKTDDEDVVAPGTQNDEGFVFSINGQPEVDGKITSTLKVQDIFLAAGEYGVMIYVENVITEANFDEFAEKDNLYYTSNDSDFYKVESTTTWDDTVAYYTLEDYVNLTGAYYPVVYTLTGDTNATGTLADIATALADSNILKMTAGTPNAETVVTYTGETTFDSNTNLANEFKLGEERLTWVWLFSANDGADTILGNLMAGNLKVVKYDGVKYTKPAIYADYCLETMFDLEITVEQVD